MPIATAHKTPDDDGHMHPQVLTLPRLPWVVGALAPVISSRTVQFHYSQHHALSVQTANQMLSGRNEYADRTPEEIVQRARAGAQVELAEAVAEAVNHTAYWYSLSPQRQRPSGRLRDVFELGFGSYQCFADLFSAAGVKLRGYGWLWLLLEEDGRLAIDASREASQAMLTNRRALLTIDLWEHAYYLDHQNRRSEYLDALIDRRLNWNYVAAQYSAALLLRANVAHRILP